MKSYKRKKIGLFLMFIAVTAIVVAVVMLLWNAIIPSVIGWTCINYWQALGLIILSRLLLGGFGKLQQSGFLFNHFGSNKKEYKAQIKYIHDKMQEMSREERREYIRKRMAGIEDEEETNDADFGNGQKE